MMVVARIVPLMLVLVGCAAQKADPPLLAASEPHEVAVELPTEGGTLHGTLLLPAGAAPSPVALIIAGSGPTDRDGNSAALPGANNSLKLLAESLAERGIGDGPV